MNQLQTVIDVNQPPLRRSDLQPSPDQQFSQWFDEAEERRVPDREAMCLSTVKSDGMPASRMVLLKSFDQDGLVFFTNFESDKAHEIAVRPLVALLFFWPTVYRQIRVNGQVEKIAREDSLDYFYSRPRASQIGAWASRQSHKQATRADLEARYAALEERFKSGKVAEPDFWGGFRVLPQQWEFWQGQPNRLHDRFRYSRTAAHNWEITRLDP